ncbi:MAG TPA: UDP-N-acetylmuramate dehydrogenase [Mycobacteriales bacterium]|nr:UDP-N-acetylmuramate dehydrogenase [Mycobacteriales bacterium]
MNIADLDAWDPRADPAEVTRLGALLDSAPGAPEVKRAHPLAPWTTLKVGGAAALLVEPADHDELAVVLRALATTDADAVPMLVMGRGSNLLVSDDGFPGIVVRLGAGFTAIGRDGLHVTAGGAASMPVLATFTANEGLSGLEFAAGVPATVGGSVRMNAGAHGGEVADCLVTAELATADGVRDVPRAELGLSYRHSALPPRSVVTGATWALTTDDTDAVRARLDEVRAWRRATQPIGERTCGSTFTNPEGDSAGRLIEAAGLKGLRVGGAQVSRMHANFIETDVGARAADVLAVVQTVQERVLAAGGPRLRPEVRVVGRF